MTQTAAVIALLVALVVSAPTFGMPRVDLVILHTNDMHARIEPNVDNEILGMPYIAALVRHYRAMYPHVLVIDAGDTLHGRPISDRLHGESTVKAMNLAGYDFMVPGNHDFNFGYDRLLELQEMMDFTLLGANVYKDGERLFRDYAVVEAAGSVTLDNVREIAETGVDVISIGRITHSAPALDISLDLSGRKEAVK